MPGTTEAYETSWYRVLARQASGELAVPDANTEPPKTGPSPEGATPSPSPGRASPKPEPSSSARPVDPAGSAQPALRPAVMPEPAPDRVAQGLSGSANGYQAGPQPVGSYVHGAAPRLERVAMTPSSVRIGVRKLEEPEAVYLGYLTASPHAEFFRSDLWPGTRALTPVHVWRANHLGAGWVTSDVLRFLEVHGQRLSQLVSVAPATAAPGSPDRHTWIRRLLHSEVVADYGVPRVAKTLHALLPTLVPDLDTEMTPWAAREWLGLRRTPEAPGDAEAWLEVWELLEDVLVVRAEAFDEIVRAIRAKAERRAPTSPAGLVAAAFWQSFWEEASREASSPPGAVPPATLGPKRAPRREPKREPKPAAKDEPKLSPRLKAEPAPRARVRARTEAPAPPRETAAAEAPLVPAEATAPAPSAPKPTRARRPKAKPEA